MPELQNYNIGQNFLAGMERGRQMGRERQLGSAAGEAFNATPDQQRAILARVAATDPQGAFELQTRLNADQDRQRTQLYNMARSLKSVYRPDNPAPAAALYQSQLAPGLRRMGFEVPEAFDPSVMDVADQVLGAYAPVGAGQVQSTQILANGNIGVVTRTGQVVDTGQPAQQSTQLVNQEGTTPFLAVTRGPGVGSTIAVGPQGAGQGAPVSAPQSFQVQSPGAPQSVDGTQDTGAGTAVTIQGATPEQNAAFGRVVDSMRAAGMGEDDINRFVAMQDSRFNPQRQAVPAPAGGPVPMRNPTAAETARAVQDAKNASDLAAYTAMTGRVAEREQATAAAKAAGEREATAAKRARDAVDAANLLDEAERLLPNATGSGLGAARDAAAAFFGTSTEGAQANASLKTIAGQLTAKMPRMEGPQSNVDVQMYKEMAGDLANDTLPVETRLAALQQIRRLQAKYAGQQGGNLPKPNTQAEFDALPSGAQYIDPDDGKTYRKR